MNDILIAFVIPIIAIILAVVLETILRCPYKVTGLIFIGLMITAFALGGDLNYIVLAWLYTFLAYEVARITERILQNCNNRGNSSCPLGNSNSSCENSNTNNTRTRICCSCRRYTN